MHSRYLLQRLLLMLLTVLAATLLTFLLLRLTPGDPAQLIIQKVFVGTEEYMGSAGEREAVEARFALDRPLMVQYGSWLGHALRLDLGTSYTSGRPVAGELTMRLLPTLELALPSLGLSLMLTILVATIYNLDIHPGLRRVIDGGIIASIAVPNFYLGILCILLFSVQLDLLPVSGYGTPAHAILPVCTLALTMFGYTTTILNDAIHDVRTRPYLMTARAKGLSGWGLLRGHVLRNAAAPVIPYVGLQLGYLLGGVVVIETLFSWPGIGKYLVDAIATKDLPVIQACIAMIAACYVLANLAADLVLWLVDPRIRFQ